MGAFDLKLGKGAAHRILRDAKLVRSRQRKHKRKANLRKIKAAHAPLTRLQRDAKYLTPNCPHPAGETKNHAAYPCGSWPVNTPAERFYAEWDDQVPVTRESQLIFFFQFLQAGGRWEEFLRECPLHYTYNRAS